MSDIDARTPEQAMARAARARALLADPLMVEAMAAMKDGIRDAFFATPAEDARKRELLHLMDRARQHFEGAFVSTLIEGAQAQQIVEADEQAEEALERIRERVRGR